MKLLWIVPACIAFSLSAQSDLATALSRVQGLSLDQIRELQARVAAEEGTLEQKAYEDAYLNYCVASRFSSKEAKQAEILIDRNLKVLEPKQDADSLALQGAFIGLKLNHSPMQGIWLNPKALRCFETAEKMQPGNPRPWILHGVHMLHMPAFAGGGAQKAIPLFENAVKAAESEPKSKNPWVPQWGRIESYAWLAIAQAEMGLAPQAEATLMKAKAFDPEHGFLNYAAGRVQSAKNKKS